MLHLAPYIGDWLEDSIHYFTWNTSATTGASITRTVNGTVSVYKDDGIAQSVVGVTDTEDFDGLTGVHCCKIDTSADAFYATGHDYSVVLSAATIDGQTVNTAIAHFSIENRVASSDVDIAKAVWDRVLTGVTHNIATSAGRRLRAIQECAYYIDGGVWVDTVNGTAGTVNYENGTISNPVDSIADALTIAASIGFKRIGVLPGSSITFIADMSGYELLGEGWTLALGGQAAANTHIHGATITGIATAGAGIIYFHSCRFGAATLGKAHFTTCGFDGNLTVSAAATYIFDRCYNNSDGLTAPVLDFGGAVGNTHIGLRAWRGGIEIANLGANGTDVFSITGAGQLLIASTCAAGTIKVIGAFTVVDNVVGGFSGTLTEDARNALIEYDPPTKTEIDSDMTFLESAVSDVKSDTVTIYSDTTALPSAVSIISDLFATAISESPTAGTVQESMLYALAANKYKIGIAGTTLTLYKSDGSTALETWTLDDATNPTSRTP